MAVHEVNADFRAACIYARITTSAAIAHLGVEGYRRTAFAMVK